MVPDLQELVERFEAMARSRLRPGPYKVPEPSGFVGRGRHEPGGADGMMTGTVAREYMVAKEYHGRPEDRRAKVKASPLAPLADGAA